MKGKLLTIGLLVLFLAPVCRCEMVVRDRGGNVLYQVDRYGNEYIYRDRSGNVIGDGIDYDQRDRRHRDDIHGPMFDIERDDD